MMFFHQTKPPELAVGDLAPEVSFRRGDGSLLNLASLRSHIVVLEFTALNCPPCRAIAPKVERLAASLPDVIFLTISTGPDQELARLASLRGAGALTHLVQDPYHADRSKMAVWKFGNVAVPTFYVIDRKGHLASRLIQDDDTLSHVKARIAWARKK